MASTSAVSMAMPLTSASHKRSLDTSFFKPLPMNPSRAIGAANSCRVNNSRLQVKASMKENAAVVGLSAVALAASMMVPEVAEAASGVSPSLTNFLKSILAGGVVVGGIIGVVIAVSSFDPVKRS